MSFSEWREVKLEEIIEIEMGQSPKSEFYNQTGEGLPFLQGNRTFGDKYPYFDTYCTENKKIANTNDVIMSVRAPVGDLNIAQTKISLGRGVCAMRLKGEQNSNYLFYLMKHNIKEMINRESGTVFGSVNKKDILGLEVKITNNKFEQKAIAHILSTLDDKIEVNNQINKILEDMAKVIFKQWFVDYEYPNENSEPYKTGGGEMIESELGLIPKGWVVGKLDDIATIVMGQSPKGTSYNEVGEGEVFYQGRTDFSSRFPIRRLFTTEPKRMANDGDVLMSVRAPVGDLNVANERCCIGRGLSAISSSADLSSYILYVMHDLRERLNVYNGEGTVFGSINQKDLKSIKVISSCDNKTEIAFDELIQPIDRMIRNNEDETRRLINLRDRLLPKLLSGEIRVPLDEEGDAS